MKDISAYLSANIKKRRKELHITQLQLAERLGYSEKAISKWESGKGLPPTAVLPDLARALALTLDELMREPSSSPLYLGIDGGGTKTEFVLADGEGNILDRLILGPSNPNDIGMSTAKELLRDGIFRICGTHPLSNISLFAGLAGGGTAGHINPALSVAKYLQENYDNVKISYIGTEKGLESRLVREAGYDFYTIEVSGFQRKINFENVKKNIIEHFSNLHYFVFAYTLFL